MEDVDWLISMLSNELEVRPPSRRKREQRFLDGDCVKLHDDGRIFAYAEMRMVGKYMEISTVLIDPKYRGKGHGKELIEKALQHITKDKILCCTKNPAMAKILENLDFKVTKWPGFWTFLILSINTVRRMFSMIFRLEFRRIWRQGKGIHKYDMFEIKRT